MRKALGSLNISIMATQSQVSRPDPFFVHEGMVLDSCVIEEKKKGKR